MAQSSNSNPETTVRRRPARPATCNLANLLAILLLGYAPSLAAEGTARVQSPVATPTQEQLEFGELLANQRCGNCHALEDGADRYAAPLHHLFGREPGTIEGYVFSANMKGIGEPWSERTLDQWLAQTTFDTPDIRMRHVGIENAIHREALIAFLSTLPGNRSRR